MKPFSSGLQHQTTVIDDPLVMLRSVLTIMSFLIAFIAGLLAFGDVVGPHWAIDVVFVLSVVIFLACIMREIVERIRRDADQEAERRGS